MRVNTRSVDFTRVQLHALPTQCPRTAHALPANTTRRLHAFYARVGAAIPLTGTVFADDTSLTATGKDLDVLLQRINSELPAIHDWLCSNRLINY